MPGNRERIVYDFEANEQDAINGLMDLMYAFTDLKKTTDDMETQGGMGSGGIEDLTNAMGDAEQGGQGLTGILSGVLGILGSINPTTILAAVGLGQLTNMFGGLRDRLREVKSEILGTVDQAQTLAINLKSLAARELVAAGEAENVAEAQDTAREAAAGMQAVLEEIGLVSPYENERVRQTFRLAMAYGWASDQAMDLTKANLDMSAALGKSGWEMQRISQNLGQIRSKGKITGREIRDLSGFGIDLAAILREELGVSVDEFNAGLENGTYTMADFSQAFSDFASRNYAGAAKELAGTIQGLRASFSDLKEVAITKTFKPAIDVLTQGGAELFDFISRIVTESGILEAIGGILQKGAKALVTRLREIGSSVKAIFDNLNTGESREYLKVVLVWIIRITKNLIGIVKAIRDMVVPAFKRFAGVVVAVLRSMPWDSMIANLKDTVLTILSVINSMLEAIRLAMEGNAEDAVDPLHEAWVNILTMIAVTLDRFLADMVTWGWNIVVQLANGIVKAANVVLGPAMQAVGNIIGLFIKPGSPPKKGPLSHIVEWGRGLINTFVRAFKTADFGLLKNSLSPIKKALQDAFAAGNISEGGYLRTFKAVREQVAGLIANFRQTGKISSKILGMISDKLGEGGKELVEYLRLQLKHQKAIQNLAKVQEEVAAAESAGFVSKELQDRLKAAEEEAEAAEDAVNWQKELINLQQESVDIQLELVKALKDVAKALKKQEPEEVGGGEVEASRPEFESGIGEFLGGGVEPVEFDLAGLDGLTGKLDGFSDKWKETREKVERFLELPLVRKLRVIGHKIGNLIGIDLVGFWDRTKRKVKGFLDLYAEDKIGAISQLLTDITGIDFVGFWESAKQTVADAREWIEETRTKIEDISETLKKKFQVAIEKVDAFIQERFLPTWRKITTFFNENLLPVLQILGWVFLAVLTGNVNLFHLALKVLRIFLVGLFKRAVEKIRGVLEKLGDYIKDKLLSTIEDLREKFNETKETIRDGLGGAIDTAKEKLRTFRDFLRDKFMGTVEDVKNIWGEFRSIVEGFAIGIRDWITPIFRNFESLLDNVIGWVEKKIAPVLEYLNMLLGLLEQLGGAVGGASSSSTASGVSNAVRQADAEVRAMDNLLSSRTVPNLNLAGANGITVIFQGGVNFPNVTSGRDADGVLDQLSEESRRVWMQNRTRGLTRGGNG
jgi:tape measure domain-containing protein